jgi:hypothetical protein
VFIVLVRERAFFLILFCDGASFLKLRSAPCARQLFPGLGEASPQREHYTKKRRRMMMMSMMTANMTKRKKTRLFATSNRRAELIDKRLREST